MSVRTHIEQHNIQMGLIGGIFTALNRLENGINHIISAAFGDPNCKNQEKMHFLSTILADEHIFCKFEEKRLTLKKLIEVADYLVKTKGIQIEFDKGKYLRLVATIQKVQEIRNDVAHNYLLPDADGASTYYEGKSYRQLIQEDNQKKSSFKTKKLDLEQVREESIKICDELEFSMGEMMEKFANIFSH
jgi:hypothetical protein